MPIFTVQQIIDRAAAAADMHDSFVQPQTWLAWFNVERQNLKIDMARGGWIPFGATQQAITATSLTGDAFTFSTEIFAILMVVEQDSAGRFRHIPTANFIDQTRQQSTGLGPITGPATRVFGEVNETTGLASLHFYPRPTSGNYVAYYLPPAPTATALSDTFWAPMGLEELIVLRMAKRALTKEESDTAQIQALIDEQRAKLDEYCHMFNASAVPKVRNVDDVERGWNLQLTYPPPNSWLWL